MASDKQVLAIGGTPAINGAPAIDGAPAIKDEPLIMKFKNENGEDVQLAVNFIDECDKCSKVCNAQVECNAAMQCCNAMLQCNASM